MRKVVLEIDVTAKDISRLSGIPRARTCPIARAAERANEGRKAVVGTETMSVLDSHGNVHVIPLPEQAREFIAFYDSVRAVNPFWVDPFAFNVSYEVEE